jgi:DNA adenine methylase
MPPHHVYLEPYAGSCAILLNKPESKLETINDIDGNVVNFFKVLRNHPEELARAVNLTPWARDEFIATREDIDDPLERARRFAVACWMGRGSRISGSKTGFRRSTSGKEGSHSARQWDRVPDRLIDAANRLKCVQIENRDALQLIQEHNLPECLIYADPPYIGDGRTCKNEYKYEMTEADHRA